MCTDTEMPADVGPGNSIELVNLCTSVLSAPEENIPPREALNFKYLTLLVNQAKSPHSR